MKKALLTWVLLLITTYAIAQLNLPQPSPAGSVSQTVGLTEVKISYSSPGVKNRKIWGELVPYNIAWRAGANAATSITFSTDVIIGGKTLKAGTYSLFITPREKEAWTFHLHENTRSVFSYKDLSELEANDLVRVEATLEEMPHRERLAYLISPETDSRGKVTMYWEKVAASFTFEVETKKYAEQAVKEAVSKADAQWTTYMSAADYQLNANNTEEALKLIEKSLALRNDYFRNHWVKSRILAKMNRWDDALNTITLAKQLGDAKPDGTYNFFKDQLEKDLNEWLPNASKDWKKLNEKKAETTKKSK
ncbi:MAG: DUF2911 domain-containing protein [Flammeovirgaceae bacterium]|nr:DUF2911 domain-containing protein [Flammeovirgaceae bacterium]MDW8286657.1 DUF2911 domain-containing protein [Flammeovirgaceae bacterium]